MDSPYYQVGNTVKLKGRFGDFETLGANVIPDEVNLIIYDYKWEQLDRFVVTDRDEEGFYFYFYTFDSIGTFYYEWLGVFDGLPSLERKSVVIKRA